MSVLSLFANLPHRWITEGGRSLRWPIVGAVLLLSAAIAYVAPPLAAMLVTLTIAALFVVLAFLRWPPLGLAALIPVNMVVPLYVGTGSGSNLNGTVLLLALLGGLWLFKMVVDERKIRFYISRPILPLVIWMVVAVLAFLNGLLPRFAASSAPVSAQLGGLAIFLLSGVGFLLVAHQVRDLRWLERITWLFVFFGALFIVCRLHIPIYRQLSSLFLWGATANQFWTWLVAIVAGQALFNQELRARWRVALWVLLVAIFYEALVQTYSWTSGWLPPLVALVALLGLRSWRFAVVLGLGGLLLVPVQLSQLLAAEDYSYSTRVDAWLVLFEIIKVNPILGLGPANYYWFTSLYGIRGYFVEFNSHNQYLDLLAQMGIVGLLSFVWFFVEVARLGWRLREEVPPGFARGYVYGALGGLVATLVAGMLGDWIVPFVYNVGMVGIRSSILPWLFLGGVVALEQIMKEHKNGLQAA